MRHANRLLRVLDFVLGYPRLRLPYTRTPGLLWRWRRWKRGWMRCVRCGRWVNDITDVGTLTDTDAAWCVRCRWKAGYET